MNDPNPKRGSGRTTAGMLRVIADALESDKPVEYIDHYPSNMRLAEMYAYRLENLGHQLSLEIEVTRKQNQVFVRSLWGKS